MGLKLDRLQRGREPTEGGLNRTSVGLKLRVRNDDGSAGVGPQSNQRGIETIPTHEADTTRLRASQEDLGVQAGGLLGLNRTSVGLKRQHGQRPLNGGREPQSNQRGIETSGHPVEARLAGRASIEPAWD